MNYSGRSAPDSHRNSLAPENHGFNLTIKILPVIYEVKRYFVTPDNLKKTNRKEKDHDYIFMEEDVL